MKNSIKTKFTNTATATAKFIFLEGFKYSDETISQKIDELKNPLAKKDPPISKLPKEKRTEIAKTTQQEQKDADKNLDENLEFLDVDLSAGLERISPKLPENIKEKVLKHLENSNAISPKELQKELNVLLIADKIHLFVDGIEEVTTPVKIDAIWETTDKNPFPKGEDDIQKKLSQKNPNTDTRGFITEEDGFHYYDEEGNKQIDNFIKLSEVIKNDLSPLAKTNITANKLYEIVNNENFSRENAQTIIQAMQTGNISSVVDLQTAFSNISPEFEKLVNGIDNKYGENTRKGVRTLAIVLSKIITESRKTIVKYKTKKVKKWYLQTNVNQNFGGVSGKGFVEDPNYSVLKQISDENTYTGKNNSIILTPIYNEERDQDRVTAREYGPTIKFEKGKRIPLQTPIPLTNEEKNNKTIIDKRNKKLAERKQKKQEHLNS